MTRWAYVILFSNPKVLFFKEYDSFDLQKSSHIIYFYYKYFIILAALRKVFQRAVCVPMDESDIFWKEYEILEKMAGEHLAEKVLPEYSEKHMHANAIFKERRRVGSKIDVDRLAVPPTNSMQELQQLSAWNKWIRYSILISNSQYFFAYFSTNMNCYQMRQC